MGQSVTEVKVITIKLNGGGKYTEHEACSIR